MLSIDVQIERYADKYTDSDQKARHYGIGQYRYIPGRKKVARVGIVKKKRGNQSTQKTAAKKGQVDFELCSVEELDFSY